MQIISRRGKMDGAAKLRKPSRCQDLSRAWWGPMYNCSDACPKWQGQEGSSPTSGERPERESDTVDVVDVRGVLAPTVLTAATFWSFTFAHCVCTGDREEECVGGQGLEKGEGAMLKSKEGIAWWTKTWFPHSLGKAIWLTKVIG